MKAKINKLALTLSAIAMLSSNAIAAEENPWYVGLSLTQADLGDVSTVSTEAVANVSRSIGIESDSETGFMLNIGRTLFTTASGHKLSAELSYANSDHDVENLLFMGNAFLASEGRAEGSAEVETILARLKYAFNVGKFNPYVGVGIGQSDLDVGIVYGGSVGQAVGAQPPFADGSDSATAFELRAGVEYKFSDAFGVYLEYSTLDVDDISFSRTGGGPGGLATTQQVGDFDVDAVNFGFNYRF